MDEEFPTRKDDALVLLARQDLTPLSRDELQGRIAALEAEIARTRAHLAEAGSVQSAAEALFSRK